MFEKPTNMFKEAILIIRLSKKKFDTEILSDSVILKCSLTS